jgi:hypothetical protein
MPSGCHSFYNPIFCVAQRSHCRLKGRKTEVHSNPLCTRVIQTELADREPHAIPPEPALWRLMRRAVMHRCDRDRRVNQTCSMFIITTSASRVARAGSMLQTTRCSVRASLPVLVRFKSCSSSSAAVYPLRTPSNANAVGACARWLHVRFITK